MVGPGSDQHVPAVAAGVGHDPGIAECLVMPLAVVELFVPARIGDRTGLAGLFSQVIRSGEVAYPMVWTLPAGVKVAPV